MKKGSHHTIGAKRILAEKAYVITTEAWADPNSALRNRKDAWPTRRANGTVSGSLKGKTYEEIYGAEGAKRRMAIAKNPNTWRGFNVPNAQRRTFRQIAISRLESDPEYRAQVSGNMSRARQKMWDNMPESEKSERIYNVVKHNQIRPTKAEERLGIILQTHYPSEYGYNGDCSLGIVIGGMIPDFVNVNGRKEAIEMFGDYWHSAKVVKTWRGSELGRMMAYNALGFRCLIVWEGELKDEGKLIAKIKAFRKEKKH